MSWSIEIEGRDATRVDLTPHSGKIVIETPQAGAEHDTLGGNRTIWQAPASRPRIDIPPLHFEGDIHVTRLTYLVTSGLPLTLRTDTGAAYRVKAIGGIKVETEDTPDRQTHPIHTAHITLRGI